VDAALTSTATIQLRVSDGANTGTAANQLITIDATAPTQTVTIDSISDDSGTAGDFITNDNDGLTIGATLSAVLGAGELLEYSSDNGVTWTDISGSVTGTAVSHVDAALTSTATIQLRVSDGANTGTAEDQLITVLSPPINDTITSNRSFLSDTPDLIAGVSVSDLDGDLTSVQLTVENGYLSAVASGSALVSDSSVATLSDGLLAHYTFEGTTDTQRLTDKTGNGNTLTNEGVVFNGDGPAVFDDATDVVLAPKIALGAAWTVSAKVILTPSDAYQTLFRGTGVHQIMISANSNTLGSWSDVAPTGFKSSGYDVTALYDGQYHTITARASGGITEFFVDGSFVGDVAFQAGPDVSNIGGQGGTNYRFGSELDDAFIYNRSLSNMEILELATADPTVGMTSITITGSQEDINATLETLTYDPATGYSGADTLTMLSTDSTGLTDIDTVAITVIPSSTVTGTPGDDASLTGTGAGIADAIYGLAGNDTLTSDGGGDFLFGGTGSDTLIGSGDSDVFYWQNGDAGTDISPDTDTVNNFTLGSGGDVLHLADLLVGEESGILTDYITSITESGGNSTITLDSNGDGSGDDVNIVLNGVGVDLTALGADVNAIVSQMMTDGNLIIDT
jgi:hypothetical protein